MKHTKEQIIAKALEVFTEKSYKSLSTNQLLKELGLSKGGFYHHFESKEDLGIKVAESLFVDSFSEINSIALLDIDLVEKLDRIANISKECLSMYTENQLINYYIFLLEIKNDIPSIRDLIKDNYNELLKSFTIMFESYNNESLGMMLIVLIEGILYSSNLLKESVEENIDYIFDTFKKCVEVKQ